MNILIVWAGAFGFAITKHLCDVKWYKVSLYDRNELHLNHIEKTLSHSYFFEWKKIDNADNLKIIYDLWDIKKFDYILLAIPANIVKSFLRDNKNNIWDKTTIVNLSKWLDDEYHTNIYNVFKKIITNKSIDYAVLSGWMIAEDIVNWNLVGADLSTNNETCLNELKKIFESEKLSIYPMLDRINEVEIAWALKNIASLIFWYFKAKNFWASSLGAKVVKLTIELDMVAKELWSKGFEECRFSWMWDLIASCFWLARNEQIGEDLWKGKKLDDLIWEYKQAHKTVESINSYRIIYPIVQENKKKLPILYNFIEVLK